MINRRFIGGDDGIIQLGYSPESKRVILSIPDELLDKMLTLAQYVDLTDRLNTLDAESLKALRHVLDAILVES